MTDATALHLPQIRAVVAGLAHVDWDTDETTRIELLDALERLENAAAAAQAVGACALDDATRRADADAGVPARRRGRGVAAQLALARRESHHAGQIHLGLAKTLRAELPHTLARLQDGHLSEWRATLIARETAHLSHTHRGNVDAALCKDPATLAGWGNRRIVAEAKKLTYQLDPHAVVARNARAQSERRISCRPAPDAMAYLTALVPMTQGVAAIAAVNKAATAILGQDGGDPEERSHAQIAADVLVERLTGQTHADAVPLTVDLVLSDRALLTNCTDETAHLDGYGPIPAEVARRVITTSTTAGDHATPDTATVPVWLRRVYASPATGALVAMESTARRFPAAMADYLRLRDQFCRTPYCDAPIRHSDHIDPHAQGGATSLDNGDGLCEACNHAKQADGWTIRTTHHPSGLHTIGTTTPAGITYLSTTPPAPGHDRRLSLVETELAARLDAA